MCAKYFKSWLPAMHSHNRIHKLNARQSTDGRMATILEFIREISNPSNHMQSPPNRKKNTMETVWWMIGHPTRWMLFMVLQWRTFSFFPIVIVFRHFSCVDAICHPRMRNYTVISWICLNSSALVLNSANWSGSEENHKVHLITRNWVKIKDEIVEHGRSH